MNVYNDAFYKKRHSDTFYSAQTIVSIVQEVIPEIKSAVDLGCGVGTWLYVLKEKGTEEILGIDGNWVTKDYLVIPAECFLEHDLSKDLKLNKSYDLAISVEVAEHLPEKSAKGFIASLTKLSDFVLFSAASPGQGGRGHLNEQFANYWISLFEDHGYVGLDIVRKRIWNDRLISSWYRQNIILFVKKTRISDLKINNNLNDHIPAEVYLSFLASPRIKQTLTVLFREVKNRIKRKTGLKT